MRSPGRSARCAPRPTPRRSSRRRAAPPARPRRSASGATSARSAWSTRSRTTSASASGAACPSASVASSRSARCDRRLPPVCVTGLSNHLFHLDRMTPFTPRAPPPAPHSTLHPGRDQANNRSLHRARDPLAWPVCSHMLDRR